MLLPLCGQTLGGRGWGPYLCPLQRQSCHLLSLGQGAGGWGGFHPPGCIQRGSGDAASPKTFCGHFSPDHGLDVVSITLLPWSQKETSRGFSMLGEKPCASLFSAMGGFVVLADNLVLSALQAQGTTWVHGEPALGWAGRDGVQAG